MNHTPLPWAVNYKGSIGHIKSIAETKKETGKYPLTPTVCRFKELAGVISKENAEANAEFIVRACNNHYKLLEALKDLMIDAGGGSKACGHDFTCNCAWDKAKEAIKEAEE